MNLRRSAALIKRLVGRVEVIFEEDAAAAAALSSRLSSSILFKEAVVVDSEAAAAAAGELLVAATEGRIAWASEKPGVSLSTRSGTLS